MRSVSTSDDPFLGRGAWFLGAACLGTATLASGALALQHLGAFAPPGCSFDSPCSRAITSVWGTLPGLHWPVAFAGASHFAALLAAWMLARRTWPSSLCWLGRLGALISLVFLGALLALRTPCPYCLTSHAANLVFVLVCGRRASAARARRPELVYVGVALATTLLLAAGREAAQRAGLARDELALSRSTQLLRSEPDGLPFTGRHRLGPERAAIRLVLFTDYQCQDCARIEREAQALVAERADVSLSVKHFPLCKDCNSRARELNQNPHPNACWAARAAEAAGIVAGDEGFWRMHRWLFERGGAFVDAELMDGLASLGFARAPFIASLQGAETLARVQVDVAEALALGIQSTPLVFINGVELRGWRAPDALRRALDALAATAPPAATAEVDRPPAAMEKLLADWMAEPLVALPPEERGGAAAGPAPKIVLWGDYLDPSTRELDRELRDALGTGAGSGYSFRHYPLDSSCDKGLPDTHPGACLAARAAEAARACGGVPALAGMHEWLMAMDGRLALDALRAAAERLELDTNAWLAALESGDVLAAVRSDVAGARRLGIRSIPFLFVAGRRVPRWKHEGGSVLGQILEAAGR